MLPTPHWEYTKGRKLISRCLTTLFMRQRFYIVEKRGKMVVNKNRYVKVSIEVAKFMVFEWMGTRDLNWSTGRPIFDLGSCEESAWCVCNGVGAKLHSLCAIVGLPLHPGVAYLEVSILFE
jgi:hypothetical protein